MSKKGLKENQIFAARDTVEENDKIKAAREDVAADPTNAEKYMALGLALRSLGHGRRVLIAQFLKDGRSGELAALKTFERATVYPAKPISGFVFAMTAAQKEEAAKQQNAQAADLQSEAEGLRPALTVLDELNVALACGMVMRENAERLIDAALAFGDVVSTGRNAPEWLREKADYVSEIIARKHPFQTEKLAAREGIEY